MPATTPEGQRLEAALNQIDTATTQAGTGLTGVAQRLARLLEKIADTTPNADVKALADQASAEVARIQPIADSLTEMAKDPANPIPTPVPTPDAPPPAGFARKGTGRPGSV